MSSRVPRTIGATSSSTGPSSGRAAAEQLGCRMPTAAASAHPEPHEAPFGLVRDRVAAQLYHDGIADRVGRGDRLGGAGDRALVEDGDAVTGHELLGRGFREGRHRRRG